MIFIISMKKSVDNIFLVNYINKLHDLFLVQNFGTIMFVIVSN